MGKFFIRASLHRILILFLVLSVIFGSGASPTVQAAPPAPKSLAYVFYGADVDANAFKGYLEGLVDAGGFQLYTVTLIPLASITALTSFVSYDLVIIADDTGLLNGWGTPPDATAAAQIAQITAPNKPILGIGEGGYAFFGKLSLFNGWPHGWHGPQDSTGTKTLVLSGNPSETISLYINPVNSVGIYIDKNVITLPADVTVHGVEPATPDHADQIQQNCHFLWGNSGSPALMVATGKKAFSNYVAEALSPNNPCSSKPSTPPQDPNCLELIKEVTPAGAVAPGDVLTYKLRYLLNPNNCAGLGLPKSGLLLDAIPFDTTYVPGSASGGGTLDAAGKLNWSISSLGTEQNVTFKVVVSESQCADQKVVLNRAEMDLAGFSAFPSNQTSNTVTCPPVMLPNNSTFYAEDELQISPYPLTGGSPSMVSLELRNTAVTAQTMTVQFQVAPLGIGQLYTTFNTQSVTLPGSAGIKLTSPYTPPFSGQASFQAVITTPNQTSYTQSNLDLSEDFKPGVQDTLAVPVRNTTAGTTVLSMVIDNTCPGWSALVDPATTPSLASGASTTVSFKVTPPTGILLGTLCHIDLQAWAGTTLVGGIRKLDIPPVHLPPHVSPPWEEPEISFSPNNPPIAGMPGQICIDLTNPTSSVKHIELNVAVADFGAGIGFTPISSVPIGIDVPANSSGRYCIDWTPSGTGTLHKCVLVTLSQAGYQDMHSQHNIDITRTSSADLSTLVIPFQIGNPDGVPHTLHLNPHLIGIDPYWSVRLTDINGVTMDPNRILIGLEKVQAQLHFTHLLTGSLASLNSGPLLPSRFDFGAASQVQVGVYLDGRQVGGFTVQINTAHTYLPSIRR